MNKNIVFFHWCFPYGGAEMVTCKIANYLSSQGWNVAVISPQYLATQFPDNIVINFTLRTLPENCSSKQQITTWICNYLNESNIGFFVCKDEVLTDLEYLREHTKTKLIYHHHCTPFGEVVQEEEEYKSHSRTFLKRIWVSAKYQLFGKQIRSHKKDKQLSYYTHILNHVDSYIVLCQQYKDIFNQHTHFKFDEKIFPIYNCSTHPDTFTHHKQKEILYVGRLSFSDKRVDRLLTIWSKIQQQIPDWSLKIVGDGPEMNNLKNLSYKLNLKNVSFIGWVQDVTPYYKTASIICLTSNLESWGLAIADAQCYGVVPICFDISAGVSEIISPNGVNGYIVPAYDLSAYAYSLVELCQNDAKLKEIQNNVFEKSFDYSIQNTGNSWIKMLNTIS